MEKHKDPASWEHVCDQCGRHFHKKAALVAHMQRTEKSGACLGEVNKGRGKGPGRGTVLKRVGRVVCPECDAPVREGAVLQVIENHSVVEDILNTTKMYRIISKKIILVRSKDSSAAIAR